jgi:radical SAM protein with 4Fe4S-binding SPASM domain
MKARLVRGQAPGGKRSILADVLPLKTPLVVQIFPIYACNFRCNYCVFSTKPSERGFVSDETVMDFELFKKCVDEMAQFPDKLKVLRFVGMGEPLLHKHIARMVEYTVQSNIAERVEILSNASLLDRKMTDSLLQAGLSRLIVSLQGTSKEKYKEVCKADIDFVQFVENIRYFYNHKGTTQLHVKIIDYALDGSEDEQKFFSLFGDICDSIGIEYAGPIYPWVDYGEVLKASDKVVTQFGLPPADLHICPQPFFTLQINPDGKVVPCYSIDYPRIVGDCNELSVVEIWNSTAFNDFRRAMLDGADNASAACRICNIIKHRLFPEDMLNDAVDRLKGCYA